VAYVFILILLLSNRHSRISAPSLPLPSFQNFQSEAAKISGIYTPQTVALKFIGLQLLLLAEALEAKTSVAELVEAK